MTDAQRRAQEAANAVYAEQESNTRAAGDAGPEIEESSGEFAELAEEESEGSTEEE